MFKNGLGTATQIQPDRNYLSKASGTIDGLVHGQRGYSEIYREAVDLEDISVLGLGSSISI